MIASRALLLAALAVLVVVSAGLASAHYTPAAGDRFAYDETVAIGNGIGNYSGYTESTTINGSLGVTAVLSNGTDKAYYFNDDDYRNSEGVQENWSSSGTFVFSPQTFRYVEGTDNQTGYVNPSVWFFIDNSLAPGMSITLLNSGLTIVGTSVNYALDTSAGSYVKAIFAEGNGSYQRNDIYGVFTAEYNWKAYFDPSTGYVIGYVYTEQDSDGTGDGFTLTDTLAVTSTSYALTAGTAPPSSSNSGSPVSPWLILGIVLAFVVIVVVVVVLALRHARRRQPLPKHSATGQVTYVPPPIGPPPPAVQLTPSGQPAVQQIIIRETVKVKCQYCGALIDSTAERCPFCGAART